jgi:hypothetical protein
MYFFDEAETNHGAISAEVVVVLHDDAVRDMALRAAGLSEHSLKAISDMVDRARSPGTASCAPFPPTSPTRPPTFRR